MGKEEGERGRDLSREYGLGYQKDFGVGAEGIQTLQGLEFRVEGLVLPYLQIMELMKKLLKSSVNSLLQQPGPKKFKLCGIELLYKAKKV